jgi:putative sterol carrier protein
MIRVGWFLFLERRRLDVAFESAATYINDVLKARIDGNPARAKMIGGVFEFVLEGDNGGTWTLDLTKPVLREGPAEKMNCRIRMAGTDFLGMVNGTLGAMDAFKTGKLKVEGNLAMSLKLQVLLDPKGW